VGENSSRILELAKGPGEAQSLLVGLYGMWCNANTQGRIADALGWANRLLSEGMRLEDPELRLYGHFAAMACSLFLGQPATSREHGDAVLALFDPHRTGRLMALQPMEVKTTVGIWASLCAWSLGYPDQAARLSDERDEQAREMGNPFNLCHSLTMGADVFNYRREPARLLERVREADRVGREQHLPFVFDVLVPISEGLASLRAGCLPDAVTLLRRAIENWGRLGGHTRMPYLKSALAEALALQGDLTTALGLVDESLEQIARPGWGERWHLVEILRLKGWMLMRQCRWEEAEHELRASIEEAGIQKARSWGLRSSTTLAQLLAERGRRQAALEILSPAYHWFTEGFDTRDLEEAHVLLEQLA